MSEKQLPPDLPRPIRRAERAPLHLRGRTPREDRTTTAEIDRPIDLGRRRAAQAPAPEDDLPPAA